MKITNHQGLPQSIVDAVSYDNHKTFPGADRSVSTFVDAPQIWYLRKTNKVIETDASEMVFALMGTAVHYILEKANIKSYRRAAFETVIETLQELYEKEKHVKYDEIAKDLMKICVKMFPELEERYIFEKTMSFEFDGMVISMTFDIYDKIEKKLMDYKVCSVYQYMFEESRKKWFSQQNCYVYGLRKAGFEVESASIIAIFRDYQKSKKGFGDYPPEQIMEIPVPIFSDDNPNFNTAMMEKYLASRVRVHRAVENGERVDCTGKEKWASAPEWAVVQVGGKKARRVCVSESQAREWMAENKHKAVTPMSIQYRPGANKRCEEYCPVRDFCPQREREIKESAELLLIK